MLGNFRRAVQKFFKRLKKEWAAEYTITISEFNSLEVQSSFSLNWFGILKRISILVVLLTVITVSLIFFTPVREYVPGYATTDIRRRTLDISRRLDSLRMRLQHNDQYVEGLRQVFEDTDGSTHDLIGKRSSGGIYSSEWSDSLLRTGASNPMLSRKIQARSVKTNTTSDLFFRKFFIPPVENRHFTNHFNQTHLALDIACKEGTVVKAISLGVVVLSEWTFDTGYVIILRHQGGVLSVYKHNSGLLKIQGDVVATGDPIAVSGTTGELTTGPHLHFELWVEGNPVDPMNYIPFD